MADIQLHLAKHNSPRTRCGVLENSASAGILAVIMDVAHLNADGTVDVREENGRVVIDTVRPRAQDVARLLECITPAIRHSAGKKTEVM